MDDLDISDLVKALTNGQDIIGKSKYFNSAVVVPVVNIEGTLHLLFEKRANKIRQGGEVSFPGGEFDTKKDKSLMNTALRECTEELGIDTEKIEVIGKLGTLVAPMGVTVDAFVCVLNINSMEELKIDTNEVERVFTLPLNYFLKTKPSEYFVSLEVHPSYMDTKGKLIELLPVKKLGLPERYQKPWKNGKHKILVYEKNEEVIWGITAAITFEFTSLISSRK